MTTTYTATPARGRRAPWAGLLALLLIGLFTAYLIASETPRGTVSGVAVLKEGGKPLSGADVYLTPLDRQGRSRKAVTDADGRFTLRRVTEGAYSIQASSRWHASPSGKVRVEEGRNGTATLRLSRTEPDINVGDRQTAFSTGEKPFLPVRGYVSAQAGRDPKVRVAVWRTRLSDVLRRADAAEALDRMNYTYDGPTAEVPPVILKPTGGGVEAPTLVSQTVLPLRNADREGFYHNRVPIDAAVGEPGLYLVRFTHGGKSASSYLLVSDIALVTKRSREDLLAYAVDVQKGTPVAGARVRAYRAGRRLDSEQTGADGRATLNLPRPPGSEDDGPVIVATRGRDEAVVRRAGFWWGDGAGRFVAHTITDRTVYRPGDTVQFKGIVRRKRAEGDGSRRYDVPGGETVTVEMRDPTGALVLRETKTAGARGTYWGSAELSPEGATGVYSLIADIGGEKHTREVRVAAYRKPEYSVGVTPAKTSFLRGETVEFAVEAAYYFGAPVVGAKVRWYAYRDADWAALYGDDLDDETLREYAEGDYGSYYGEMVEEGEATLDENGRAVVRVPSVKPRSEEGGEGGGDRFEPQAEVFRLTAEIEDASQRSVTGEGSARVTAAERFVRVEPEGYVAAPNKPSEVYVTVRDLAGKPVPNAPVTLAVARSRWDEAAKKTETTPVAPPQQATTGPDGRARLTVTPAQAGDLRLTATTRDAGGRTATDETDLWVTSDRGDDLDTDYGDLTILTDKRQYGPGDTARVLINASRTGQTALVTVEGDRVYRAYTVPLTKKSTVLTVPVEAGWGPNVFLAACYVRDKKFASSSAPLRVAVRVRELTVSVTPTGGEKYGPGDTVTYAVETRDAASGRPVPADFSLSVVDESIYALRADDPTALRRAFYPRRSQEVSTSYSFAVEYLGDVNKAEPKIEARRKFRDTADWKPDLQTDASGRATVSVTLPDNLTTWRATVQAASQATAVGYGVSKVLSTKPFFVRLETPRYLVGGDRSRLMALVHNETGKEQTVLVRLTAADGVTLGGKDTQTLTVAAGAVGTAEWSAVASGTGSGGAARLRLTAWTPQAAGAAAQYTDGVERDLPLRAYGRTDVATFAGAVGGAAGTGGAVLRRDANAIAPETRLTLRVTPSIRGALASGIEYLIGYPYGCTEQTMSRFYPDLVVERLGLATDGAQARELPRMVRDGLARLGGHQHASGGWGWWEYDSDDPFMTAYVLVGLSAARAQGYPVEESMIRRGVEAAEKLAKSATPRQKPFLLYALAEAGYDDEKTSLLRAPFRYSAVRTGLDLAKLPPDALAYLVLLADRIGADPGPAYAALRRRAVSEGRLTSWKVGGGGGANGAYDPDATDRMATALALRATLAVEPDSPDIPSILRWLMQSRTDGWFGNTRDTAWVLVAFGDYLRRHPEEGDGPAGTLEVRLNGKPVRTLDLARDARGEPEMTVALPTDALVDGPNTLEVVRASGTGTVFYSGALRQTIAAPAGEELKAVSVPNGITVERELVRILPRRVRDDPWRLVTEPVRNGVFQQGDRLRVRLKIHVPREASYVVIEDAFPSGAEVTERGTADEEVDTWSFWYDHVDVRDDRIAYFARRLRPGTHVIEYNLRAQTPGVSRALPTHIEGMYDAGVRAESASTRLEVRP